MYIIINIQILNKIEEFSSWIIKITVNIINTNLKKFCFQKSTYKIITKRFSKLL